ncbi:hypothetical protein PAAG_11868 [Paracoccidioides lutzii Pb01]|uniref:Uncharacterized protein n=1 Tax=Paracoccidioides lutzii (strain ATCC MYA-826 / Pb01) TaxID=502779 RepID=A0A0A2VKI4_PARBA|nr:hypothetical protein PAAG_11868 [Paracoccidioides lutzii Pb01]KGQ01404.1 hypothetical protein PAAG_11868 [Paracoccidioides lutzii Pb01]
MDKHSTITVGWFPGTMITRPSILCIRGEALSPRDGLLVLEIQKGIKEFLVNCCQETLHDMDPTALIDGYIPVQPEPAITRSQLSGSPYLLLLQRPHSASQLTLISNDSRPCSQQGVPLLSAIHIFVLREDPKYFYCILL